MSTTKKITKVNWCQFEPYDINKRWWYCMASEEKYCSQAEINPKTGDCKYMDYYQVCKNPHARALESQRLYRKIRKYLKK